MNLNFKLPATICSFPKPEHKRHGGLENGKNVSGGVLSHTSQHSYAGGAIIECDGYGPNTLRLHPFWESDDIFQACISAVAS